MKKNLPIKTVAGVILSLFSAFPNGALNAQSKYATPSIDAAAGKIESKVIAWRHDIHQNPELGNQEIRTAALVSKHLESLGIEVQTGIAKTGVVGILKGGKPGPVVALRADMDALPVEEKNDLSYASKVKTIYNGVETSVMHACGHDAHVAILMGVAEILSDMKKDLKGTVKFIFQPAEEGAPKGEEFGALRMVNEGVLDNPKVDVAFGLHMSSQTEVGKINYRPAGFLAGVSDFKITVNGKPSHGSQPWQSVDPVVTAAQIVVALQTIVSRNVALTNNPAVVTVGSIHGGNRSNIISEKVELMGDIRSFSVSDKELIERRIHEIAENTAKAAGATAVVEVPYSNDYPVTFNNEALTAKMLPTLKRSAGEDNVVLVPAITGAEDFSYFAQKVPALFIMIGGMTKGKDPNEAGPHHTPSFMIDDAAFKTGIKALCNLTVDYMEMSKKKPE
ncbi:MAG: amidohydrolase [Chryseolinea sp.]